MSKRHERRLEHEQTTYRGPRFVVGIAERREIPTKLGQPLRFHETYQIHDRKTGVAIGPPTQSYARAREAAERLNKKGKP